MINDQLPKREASLIGARLDDDLTACKHSLNAAADRLQSAIHRAANIHAQRRAVSQLEAVQKLRNDPFFGWLFVEEDGKNRVYKISQAHFPELRIISWRHPLGGLFYELDPGDDYERAGGKNGIAGDLIARARISHDGAQLLKAKWEDEEGTLDIERSSSGAFALEGLEDFIREARSTRGLENILAYITPSQYRLIAQSNNLPLVIQGKAGSGKTTVAMHRLSWLVAPPEEGEGRERIDASKILIVMFNRALCSFVGNLLGPLDLDGAKLKTFHAWAFETIQSVYGGKLEIRTQHLPGQKAAQRLKAHFGILKAINAYVSDQAQRVGPWLQKRLSEQGGEDWLERFQNSSGAILPRLVSLRRASLLARDTAKTPPKRKHLDLIYQTFRLIHRKMSLYKEDLRRLLTDKKLMQEHLKGATPQDIQDLAIYQRARQKEGAKSRSSIGPCIDFDDLGLLLRIMQVKHGGLPTRDEKVFHYDHLLIDEAQDFGAVQLQVLLDAVKTRAGVTIVGDVNQKILPGVDFIGWDALSKELGLGGTEVAHLKVGHRSTRPIVCLTDRLVDVEADASGRPGETPLDIQTQDENETLDVLINLLFNRIDEAPNAHICVVCHRKTSANKLFEALNDVIEASFDLRIGHNKNFVFAPGVTITNRQQVKGLEFDTVIVFEPTARAYPESDQGRRDLYVVTSRAQERLYFLGHEARTPLLLPLVKESLLDQKIERERVSLDDENDPF